MDPKRINPKNTFLICYIDCNEKISPNDSSSLISALALFQFFRFFEIPLENITINISHSALCLFQVLKPNMFIYFEHLEQNRSYEFKHETISEFVSCFNSTDHLKTNEDSVIYIFLEDYCDLENFGTNFNIKNSQLLQLISNIKHKLIYIFNSSCNDGSLIQFIKLIKNFQQNFASNETIQKYFHVLYPLYNYVYTSRKENNMKLKLTETPYFFIKCFSKVNVNPKIIQHLTYQNIQILEIVCNNFQFPFLTYQYIIDNFCSIPIQLYIDHKISPNLSELDEVYSLLQDLQFNCLSDLIAFTQISKTIYQMDINQDQFLSDFFNQETLEELNLFYENTDQLQLNLLEDFMKSFFIYSPNLIPNINSQFDNIIIIGSESPMLPLPTYKPHPIPLLPIKYSLGSYYTSFFINLLFLEPNENGITQEDIDKQYSKIKSKPTNDIVPRLIINQTNQCAQFSFSGLKPNITIRKVFPILYNCVPIPPANEESNLQHHYKKHYYFDSNPNKIMFNSEFDKKFFSKLCKYLNKGLKIQELPIFKPFKKYKDTETCYYAYAYFHSNCILYSTYNILSISSRKSIVSSYRAFNFYLQSIDPDDWDTFEECFHDAVKMLKEILDRKPNLDDDSDTEEDILEFLST